MPAASRRSVLKSKRIHDVARLLSQVVDVGASPRQADELIDEISQLLWAVSSLDPEAEHYLKHSGYGADLITRAPG